MHATLALNEITLDPCHANSFTPHPPRSILRTTRRIARFHARRSVVDVGAGLRLRLRRLGGREPGLLPSAFQRRHPAMAPSPRGRVAGADFDAVGVVALGFGAGEGSDFVVLLLLHENVRVAAGGLQVDDCGGAAAVDVRVEVVLFVLVEVGARVGGFVFEHLHEAVEARG